MNSKKFLVGTVVGGIVLFVLGYLFYGMLLLNFFTQHSHAPAGAEKAMSELVWWALILGNLGTGALLTYVLLKLGNVNSFGSGAGIGAAVGFFGALGNDLVRYATENASDITGVLTDVVVFTVMCAIASGVIVAVSGMGKKKS
ncbi:MAG TPA: hypothetical protein VNW49_12540 [Puia sp.]|jgi:hypothetical protein|nr:hypothetical protein [Puia sp.]